MRNSSGLSNVVRARWATGAGMLSREACATMIVVGLSGCAASTVPLTVTVRDAQTKAPICGAEVFADTPSRDHPMSLETLLGQTGPRASRAMTDAAGLVTVSAMDDRAVRLNVIAPACSPRFILLDGMETPADWYLLEALPPDSGANIEINVVGGSKGTTSR